VACKGKHNCCQQNIRKINYCQLKKQGVSHGKDVNTARSGGTVQRVGRKRVAVDTGRAPAGDAADQAELSDPVG